MQMTGCVRLCLVVLCALAPELSLAITLRTKATPVQKVSELLQNLIAKATVEKSTETQVYSEFTTKTNDAVKDLGYELEKLNTRIQVQEADQESAEAELGQTQERLTDLGAKLARAQEQLDASVKQRADEKSVFDVNFKDVSESVDALQRAIQVVSARSDADGMALLQRESKSETAMHRVMVALLEEQSKRAQPEGDIYVKETSHRLIEVLKKLLSDFSGQKESLSKTEENQVHAFELTKEDLTNEIDNLTRSQAQEVAAAAALREHIASLKVAIKDDKAEKAANVQSTAELTADLKESEAMFTANQQVREQELVALRKALEIITGKAVQEKYSGNVVQKMPNSFLQVQSAGHQRVVAFLQQRGLALSSKTLSSLAHQVSADPFGKVTTMIRDLIDRLEQEAAAEASHKAWCDAELHKNKNKRDAKSQQIEKLAAELAQLEADIEDLTEQLATLASNLEVNAKTAADETAIRKEQSSANAKTISETAAGVEAVQSAIKVLQDFYNADASLLQGQPLTKYVPQNDSKRGIIDLLEVIEADFTRVLSETKAEEAQQASEYARVMADLKIARERMDKVVHDTGLAKDQKEYIRDNTQADLETTQSAMDAANKYYDTLKPMCVQVQVSFEDRDRLRKEEIEALQEAHSLLDQPQE